MGHTGEGTLRKPTEAANRLGISAKTLANWRYLGVGPRYSKLNGVIRYADSDLDSFIAERLSTGGSAA